MRGVWNEIGGRQKSEKERDLTRASQPPEEEKVHQVAYLLVRFGL